MMPLLIQYGRSAFVGRFAADVTADRGAVVVIQSARGIELGTCLGPVEDRFTTHLDEDGHVLRVATDDDHSSARGAEELSDVLLQSATSDAATFLDCEVTLDRRGAVLHAVPWGECDLDPLLAELSDRFGLSVRLLDLRRMAVTTDPPEPKTTCDKPDCGSGGGGCGTDGGCNSGGCSRKQVKSADELTAYFADLRQKMESARVPLN